MIAAGIEPYRSAFASLFSIALKETATPPRAVATFDVPAFFKDPLGHQKVASLLANDARAAYVCGIIYQTAPKADRKSAVLCANQAVRILDHWAERNVRIAGADGNLVMTYAGIGLIFAAELLDDYEGWSGLQRERFRRWVTKVYLPAARSKSRFYNNHGDWGMLGRIASHHLLDNGRAVAEDIELIKQRIDKNIARNGHMPAEIRRKERGIWYTYFALAPMTSAAEIAYNATGIDLFQYTGRDGAGLRAALDYLFRYSRNPSSWPHFDKKSELMMPTRDGWPNNLFEAMYGVYRSDEYNRSLSPVRPITFMRGHFAWAAPTLLRPMR